jgi:hypothetical protein
MHASQKILTSGGTRGRGGVESKVLAPLPSVSGGQIRKLRGDRYYIRLPHIKYFNGRHVPRPPDFCAYGSGSYMVSVYKIPNQNLPDV